MKIGLYGGTFDPIHHGHLILAREAAEQLGLEKIIFIPNVLSPHKLARTPAPVATRYAMVVAAVHGEPLFAADDFELQHAPPSYTIDTVLEMRRRFPSAELYYLIGEDNVKDLGTWRRIDELEKLVRFVVLRRGPRPADHTHLSVTRSVDISASEVRSRVAKGASIRYLVPEPVMEIIESNNLYKETSPSIPKP